MRLWRIKSAARAQSGLASASGVRTSSSTGTGTSTSSSSSTSTRAGFARLPLLALLAALSLSACELQELVDPVNTHYVRFYLQENIQNITEGFYNPSYPKPEYRSPSVIRVALCDPVTGEMRFDRYLTGKGEDANGKYIDGYIACDAGTYQLLAYNWDTESTQIMHPNNCFQAYAYTHETGTKIRSKKAKNKSSEAAQTSPSSGNSEPQTNTNSSYNPSSSTKTNPTTKSEPEPEPEPDYTKVYNAPDFLFVSKEIITTSNTIQLDTLLNPAGSHFSASNIVESYYIQIPIKGMEGVREITAVVTGMSGSKLIKDDVFSAEPVGIFTSMSKGDIAMDVTSIYAIVNTFGRIPGAESGVHLIFYLEMADDKVYSLDIDITDRFDTEDARKRRWIIIDEPIDAPVVESGSSFNPGVDEWEDVNSDIPLL